MEMLNHATARRGGAVQRHSDSMRRLCAATTAWQGHWRATHGAGLWQGTAKARMARAVHGIGKQGQSTPSSGDGIATRGTAKAKLRAVSAMRGQSTGCKAMARGSRAAAQESTATAQNSDETLGHGEAGQGNGEAEHGGAALGHGGARPVQAVSEIESLGGDGCRG